MKRTFTFYLFIMCCIMNLSHVRAQVITTIPTFSNNNGSGLVTFNFENTNAYPIEITDVSTVLRTSGSSTFTIYYNTTPVSAPPGIIPSSASWVASGTGVINSTLGGAANQTPEPVLTGISLVIPAGATYGIAVGGFQTSSTTGTMAYYSIPATPATVTFSAGGCNMINGANVSYGTTTSTAAATFTPRGFVGSITFQPQVTIQNNAGVVSLISPLTDTFCSNSMKEVSVSVKNLGANALNTAAINWSVNGVVQPPVTLPAPLPGYMDSTVIVLGDAFIPDTAPVDIKAWTSMPNGVADPDNSDDTLSTSIAAALQGVDVEITPGDTTICQGSSITLDAGTHPGNPIYIWNNGSLNQTRTVSEPGMYWVKVQSSQGCVDRDTIYVTVYPDPLVNSIALMQDDGSTVVLNVIGAQNITGYTWDFGDGTDSSGTGLPGEMTHIYAAPGEYTVTLTLSNDCGEISTSKLIKINPVGIGDVAALQKEIALFPNPARTTVTIANRAGIKMSTITIANVLGQTVHHRKNINATQAVLDISGLSSGIYNIVINTEKGVITKKLEVIK